MHRIRQALTLLIACALAVAAPLGTHAAAPQPVTIDVLIPLTGSSAFAGNAGKQSLQLAERTINEHGGIKGRPVHFELHDDQTSPQVGVQLANQLIAAKPSVIMGSTISSVCNAIAPLASSGPVEYCLSPGIHPPKGSYVFSSSISTRDLIEVLVRNYRLRGFRRLGVITTTDATGQDADNSLDYVFGLPENKGLTVVAREHFSGTDVNVAAQVARIKAGKPQALITWSTGTPFGTVLRSVSDGGLDVPVASTPGNMTFEQMSQYAQFLPKEVDFAAFRYLDRESLRPGPLRDAQQTFYGAFKRAGIKPSGINSYCWDPAFIVVDALRHVGPDASAAQVHDYLENLHGFAGILGLYDFRDGGQRGLTQSVAVIARWDDKAREWTVISKPGGAPR